MANVTETNRKPSADVDDLTASLISADTTLVNTLQAVDADIGQLTAALNANSQDVSNVGNLDAASLEASTEVTSPSVTGDTTSATNALELPTYPTLGDVPTTLTEGTLVYVEDANEIYVEDGT